MADIKGAQFAKNLDTVIVSQDPKFFDRCERKWPERWCDWERLRTFGRMALFGVSYSMLIFIPTYCFIVALYNSQVDKLREWPGADKLGHHLEKATEFSEITLVAGVRFRRGLRSAWNAGSETPSWFRRRKFTTSSPASFRWKLMRYSGRLARSHADSGTASGLDLLDLALPLGLNLPFLSE